MFPINLKYGDLGSHGKLWVLFSDFHSLETWAICIISLSLWTSPFAARWTPLPPKASYDPPKCTYTFCLVLSPCHLQEKTHSSFRWHPKLSTVYIYFTSWKKDVLLYITQVRDRIVGHPISTFSRLERSLQPIIVLSSIPYVHSISSGLSCSPLFIASAFSTFWWQWCVLRIQ